MKRFEDLTELEIKDLTELDFIKLVSLEVAYAGIAVVDKPEYPTLAKEHEKDEIVYGIDGGCIYITMRDEGEAKKLVECLNSLRSISGTEMFSVKPRRSYSEANEKLIKAISAENKKILEKYENEKTLYDTYVEKREALEYPMREKLNTIKDKYARLDHIKHKYENTYLSLADNDVEIARRFVRDAFQIDKADEHYVFGD